MQHRPPGLNVPPLHVLCTLRCDDHPICLNQESCSDLTWWCELFHRWDGLSFFLMPEWAPIPDFQVSSDATGTLGYGAIFQHQWFCGPWSASQQPLSIAYRELFPIVVAAYLWGPQWSSRRVEFLCDNESVVAVLSSGTFRDSKLMFLMHFLALLAVRRSFSFKASSVTDTLLHFQFQRFRRLAPWVGLAAAPGPLDLLKALLVTCPFFNSPGASVRGSQGHVVLWAACCLGFFGFLHADGFAANSLFDPSVGLGVSDVQANTLQVLEDGSFSRWLLPLHRSAQ